MIPDLERSSRRLPRWMISLGIAAAVVALVLGHARFAAGLGLGAAVAILAYFWLQEVVATVLDRVSRAEHAGAKVPKGMVFKLAIRYPLALGAVYFFYKTKWLPFEAVLLGLFVPVAGALGECLLVLSEFVRRPGQSAIANRR